jgi:hypothetical protein
VHAETALGRAAAPNSAFDLACRNLSRPAKLHVFVIFPHGISFEHMKNINEEGENASENLDEKKVKKLVILATVGLKMGQKILEKLQSVEDSIEIVAREVKRLSDNAK